MSIEKGQGKVGSRLSDMGTKGWKCWNAADERRVTKARVKSSFKQEVSVDNCP